MPNTVTILDTLAIILGMYHATLDLEIFFFFWSIPQAIESQDQFAFMREEQQ